MLESLILLVICEVLYSNAVLKIIANFLPHFLLAGFLDFSKTKPRVRANFSAHAVLKKINPKFSNA
jgi:hypothetical protein